MKGATGEKIVRKKNAWDISIHAPVKGATSRGRRFFPDLRISIHAPVKGATLFFRRLFVGRRDFNPRTREGCDDLLLVGLVDMSVISIHAPVKGAT